MAASASIPSRPPHSTNTSAPSSPPSSIASQAFLTDSRRIAGSLAVNAPSLKTGRQKRFVVTMGTCMPVASRARRKRLRISSRSLAVEPYGTRSLSWKLTPYAPRSASRWTESTGSSGARTSVPKGSRPGFPTVQSPKVKWSSGLGVKGSVMVLLSWPRPVRSS